MSVERPSTARLLNKQSTIKTLTEEDQASRNNDTDSKFENALQ